MPLDRRGFLLALGACMAGSSCRMSLEQGLYHPCLEGPLPDAITGNDRYQAAWSGLQPARVWDCHVHLAGAGDGGDGVWSNPDMANPFRPAQFIRRHFYLNAACVDGEKDIDAGYVRRLRALCDDLPDGMQLMLLAFDYRYQASGVPDREHSALYIPDGYAAAVAAAYAGRFEWIASIHPYREDAVAALGEAVRTGAQAVKWLPAAMGMDPASARCDAFYEALAGLDVPLLVHADEENAVVMGPDEGLGNPLRLRRALDHGVRVIIAHCATMGSGTDLDRGPHGPRVPYFDLFTRLMDDARYEGRVFGDISAVTQVNRFGAPVRILIERDDWHGRLLYGSDYPLPAIMPDKHISGICRFYLQQVTPNFRLYVSPINIDPSDPAVQITEPEDFITDISRDLDLFYNYGEL